MIIDCISDLHGHKPELEGGDLLIVAGDLTACDSILEYKEFDSWLGKQNYKKKVVVGGNHDNFYQRCYDWNAPEELKNGEFLYDSGTEFEGLKIWGSPWTLKFRSQNPKCMAFGLNTETQMQEKWALIPNDVNILVTHSPPYGTGDKCSWPSHRVGCQELAKRVESLLHLKLHVFGHIHEGHGKYLQNDKIFVNAAQMDQVYDPVNKPVRVEL